MIMRWVDEALDDFGRGMGFENLSFNEQSVVALDFERAGRFFVERAADRIVVYLARDRDLAAEGLPARALGLCHYDQGLPFVVNAHVQVFDDDMAYALADAGCMILKFGLESGSAKIRKDVLWRFMSNEQIVRSFEAAHRHNLHTSAFIMFGLPFEGRDEIMETIRLCAQVQMGRFRWAIFFPFAGTAGHRIADELGLINQEKMAGLGNYFDGTARPRRGARPRRSRARSGCRRRPLGARPCRGPRRGQTPVGEGRP